MTTPSALHPISAFNTLLLTTLALLAFAANSVLCRLALSDQQGPPSIDAASFTLIRLTAGAITLWLILGWRSSRQRRRGAGAARTAIANGSWSAAALLFVYAICFSLAYNSLSTATGALVLFGFVQLSIFATGLLRGSTPTMREFCGLLLALCGLVYLLLPGLGTPSLVGFVLMAVAGIAWGGYTLKGKGSMDPLADTTWNFSRSLPLMALLLPLLWLEGQLSLEGTLLAIASGALASGVGYSIWYRALAGLSATQAGVVQLLVPVIAAFGGVVLVAEPLSWRLVAAATLILGGIGLTLARKRG